MDQAADLSNGPRVDPEMLGSQLRRLRREHCLTQARLGQLAGGLSQQQVSQAERHPGQTGVFAMGRLFRVFGLKLVITFGDEQFEI